MRGGPSKCRHFRRAWRRLETSVFSRTRTARSARELSPSEDLACRDGPIKARDMATSLTAADAENVNFWRELRPSLSIEGGGEVDGFQFGDVSKLMEQLRFEGYVNVAGVVPEKLVVAMRECIALLHDRKIPLAFAFVYDQAWQVFKGLTSFMEA